jgi:hypothetical protein
MSYRIIKQYIKEVLLEAPQINELNNWNYFHISLKDLGNNFLFTPRIPKNPYKDINDDIIEDITTKRTSWSTSINRAIYAISGDSGLIGTAYVYATNDIGNFIDPSETFYDCPSGPDGNEYGYGFIWKKYEDELKNIGQKINKNDKLKHCVPDVVDTLEVWALQPVKGKKIGTIENGKFIPHNKK